MKSLTIPSIISGISCGFLGYSNLFENRNFILRNESLHVLKPEAKPFSILHISDIHMTENQKWKEKWISSLSELSPDFVINTGDNFSSLNSLDALKRTLDPLTKFPGAFVAGSNDYIAPKFKNPFKYLIGNIAINNNNAIKRKYNLPYKKLFEYFENAGWLNLINKKAECMIKGNYIEFSGVDDPHLNLDLFQDFSNDFSSINSPTELKFGVIHAPYQNILNKFANSGSTIIFAGHTHGGQLRIPFYGSIVANCDIPLKIARGLSVWKFKNKSSYLHISAGLGSSRYFPFRFACRPEATLIKFLPKKV